MRIPWMTLLNVCCFYSEGPNELLQCSRGYSGTSQYICGNFTIFSKKCKYLHIFVCCNGKKVTGRRYYLFTKEQQQHVLNMDTENNSMYLCQGALSHLLNFITIVFETCTYTCFQSDQRIKD